MEVSDKFLEENLGSLIYILGERNFDCIKKEFWHEKCNENKPFTQEQLDDFRGFLVSMFDDLFYKEKHRQ